MLERVAACRPFRDLIGGYFREATGSAEQAAGRELPGTAIPRRPGSELIFSRLRR